MTTPTSEKASNTHSDRLVGLKAADFLLGPEEFVNRCVAIHTGTAELLTEAQRASLAEAIRFGRPRIEVVEAVRRYVNPANRSLNVVNFNNIAQDWNSFIITDELIAYAREDDSMFVQQVYIQTLNRLPTSIEAVEAKFDLRGGLSRTEFVERMARRSPACRLSTDVPFDDHSTVIDADGKFCINLIQPTKAGGWSVAKDVFLQQVASVDGYLQLDEGFVLMGPKRSLPAGTWHLSLDIIQPEPARITVDVVANSGLDVLSKVELVGPARMIMAVLVEPWHNFIEVRLHKETEIEHLRKLKIRQISLRQA